MRVLIIGGTKFLGRHVVEAALARGDRVTLFNRGQTNPELYPEVERLHGDRASDLAPLRGRTWDAVIDTSGYVPRIVRASAQLLAPAAAHYTFISSLSVYADFAQPVDENSPVETLPDATVEELDGGTYGGLKALCEREVDAAFGDRALHVRAGLIVGPYDPLNRFLYWLRRLRRAGPVLAPGQPSNPVQLIDARDIADWVLRSAESGTGGVFNATGPGHPLTIGELLQTIATVEGVTPELVWAADSYLVRKQVPPLDGVPLWLPPEYGYFFRVNAQKAQAAGLTYRLLAQTVTDTLAWLAGAAEGNVRPDTTSPRPGPAGLAAEQEAALLGDWWAERRIPAD